MSNGKNQQNSLPPVEDAKSKAELIKLLTPREREVLELLAQGYTNVEIAKKLHISKHTVKNHVSNIYQKLQVYDRTQMALLAIQQGLISID